MGEETGCLIQSSAFCYISIATACGHCMSDASCPLLFCVASGADLTAVCAHKGRGAEVGVVFLLGLMRTALRAAYKRMGGHGHCLQCEGWSLVAQLRRRTVAV